MYSDYLDVSYAYHWLRAPVEVYGESLTTYDGISAVYQGYVGEWELEAQALYGTGESDQSALGKNKMTDAYGFNASVSNDWLKVRAAIVNTEAAFIQSEGSVFTAENPGRLTYAALGTVLTFGDYFLGAEATTFTGDDLVQLNENEYGIDDTLSYMVTTGYRFGDFTPHLTYASRKFNFAVDDLNGDGTVFPPIYAFDGASQEVNTLIAGLRWDFHPSAALKVEYTNAQDKSSDIFIALQGETKTVSTVALGIDVVF